MDAQVLSHKLHVNILYINSQFTWPILLAGSLLLYLFINASIFLYWFTTADKYYKENKIKYIDKIIIFMIDIMNGLSTAIVFAFYVHYALKTQNYIIYTKATALHVKLSWKTSASYIDVIRFYKLALAVFAIQYVSVILPTIVLQTMKHIRGKQLGS